MGILSPVSGQTVKRALTPTAVAIGASAPSEDAEGAYIPLRAFAEAGTEAAKTLYKKAKKAIKDGMPEDDLYRKYGVYRSEDGDFKVDVAEIKARNVEYIMALDKFIAASQNMMNKRRKGSDTVGTMADFLPSDSPVLEYFPELKDTKVRLTSPDAKQNAEERKTGGKLMGAYYPDSQEIIVYLPTGNSPSAAISEEAQLGRAAAAFGTLMHEFQHHLQATKGSKNVGSSSFEAAGSAPLLSQREMDVRKELRDIEELINEGLHSNDDVARQTELLGELVNLEDIRTKSNQLKDSHAIYVRELGEAEAKGSGLKAHLPEDERRQLGVFYPTSNYRAKPTLDQTQKAIATGEINEIPSGEVLIRTTEAHPLPGFKTYSTQGDPKAVKGKGFVDLPSSALAGVLGLDMTRRVVTDGLDEESKEALDDYVQGRTGFKASDMSYAESDLVTEAPIIGDALFAADILSMIGEANQMEEGEEQPEAIDEFTGVETPPFNFEALDKEEESDTPMFSEGGLMDSGEDIEMACGGSLEKEGMGVGGIMSIEIEEVPPGSLPNEVADDVPALLSEGEYVVPADVVRWHGLKTLEMLRTEAKMALGMMAEDGRIKTFGDEEPAEENEEAEYEEDETAESEEHEAEEEDSEGVMSMPKVTDIDDNDYAKPIKAADGGDVQTAAPKPTYYSYTTKLNPETGRYEFVPVEVETGEVVTQETYDPARASRYSVKSVMDEIYGGLGAEDTPAECGEGYVWDEETQSCVPEEEKEEDVVKGPLQDPSSGEGPQAEGPKKVTPYSEQLTTKIAENLGPLSAEQLEDQEGDTLAQKAVSRMMQPTEVDTRLMGLPFGIAIMGAKYAKDIVDVKRAALTRSEEFSSDPLAERAYNYTWSDQTNSFVKVTPSTQITELGVSADGSQYVSDWNQLGSSGKEYNITRDFDTLEEEDWNDIFDQIDKDFDAMPAISGENTLADPDYKPSTGTYTPPPKNTDSGGDGDSGSANNGLGSGNSSQSEMPTPTISDYTPTPDYEGFGDDDDGGFSDNP